MKLSYFANALLPAILIAQAASGQLFDENTAENAASERASGDAVTPDDDANQQADRSSLFGNNQNGGNSENDADVNDQIENQNRPGTESEASAASGSSNNQGGSETMQNSQNQSTENSGVSVTANSDQRWRVKQYNGRTWYWVGDRGNGHWTYWDNGRWIDYSESTQSDSQVQASPATRTSYYRGPASAEARNYYGPFYFDGTGRRYFREGSRFAPDNVWNNEMLNGTYRTKFRTFMNNNAATYGDFRTRAGVTLGQAVGGNVGGGIGRAIDN